MANAYFNVNLTFDSKEVQQKFDRAVKESPREIEKAVQRATSKGLKSARSNTKKVTGQAAKSFKQKKLKDPGAEVFIGGVKPVLRRQIYSPDVAVRIMEGGRKAGYGRSFRGRKPRRVGAIPARPYLEPKVVPEIDRVLKDEINKALDKIAK